MHGPPIGILAKISYMNTQQLADRIHIALNEELLRRLLIRYFVNKGYENNFNHRIYPPLLQDLTMQIPQLSGKVEVVPFVEDIDPNTGQVKLGWNLFVLGTRRMFLGESTHTNFSEIRNMVGGVQDQHMAIEFATPKRVINFVVKVLGRSKYGDISQLSPQLNFRTVMPSAFGHTDQSGYFKTLHRPVL